MVQRENLLHLQRIRGRFAARISAGTWCNSVAPLLGAIRVRLLPDLGILREDLYIIGIDGRTRKYAVTFCS